MKHGKYLMKLGFAKPSVEIPVSTESKSDYDHGNVQKSANCNFGKLS
jgi:hypothetical protein